ncbi:MAG: monovalent cation/H+ antiporter complex subunit F [Candidatus Methanofastidiosia archaeon]
MVAIDTTTTITTIVIVLLAYLFGNETLIDVAIVYAILSFISVIAIARYLEARG